MDTPKDAVARPFVKFAGGKTQLLPELMKYVPPRFGRYFEAFVGGGALYFALASHKMLKNGAVLGDANRRLVGAYCGIRNSVDRVIEALRAHETQYRKEWKFLDDDPPYGRSDRYFVSARDNCPAHGDDVAMAAWVILMNKAGWNGLWRENLSGRFNAPPGKFRSIPTICDEENIRAVSAALQNARILYGDFEQQTQPKEGDFWYADPPYWPAGGESDFTQYTRHPFGPAEQTRLRNAAIRLKAAGVHVMLSNADVEPVRDLYLHGFDVRRVDARRSINSKTGKRGNVGELIIT